MKCFQLSNGEKKDSMRTPTKSVSVQSSSSYFTDRDVRRSGSELSSQNVSGLSTESMGRPTNPTLSPRPSNLKVFTFAELKSATKNFSRSAKIGEGGFGCVYTGVIKNPQDPLKKLNVAVKQHGSGGLQQVFHLFAVLVALVARPLH